MNTLWDGSALPAYPRLEEHLIADVAVVGGGMAGILTAFALHRNGLRVVLLEEDRLAGGVTADTTARISAQHGLFCRRLIDDFGTHLARQYLMAQLHAVKQYRDLVTQLGIDCDFAAQDSFVFTAPNGPDLEPERLAALRLGAPVRLCAVDGLPFPVREALCFENQARLSPLKFLAALLPGLTVYEHSPVRDIRAHLVRCDGGTVEASHIVITSHFPMLEGRGHYHLRVRQEQTYLLALSGAPRLDGWYLDADTRGWSLQQCGETLILSGGTHRCGTGSGDGFERLRAQAKLWFPASSEVGAWSAQDCVTLDGVPYIGAYSSAAPYLHVATGFGRWGMTNSMVSATLLTADILGRNYPYADVFSPARFFPSASIEAMMEGALYAVRGKRRLHTAAELAARDIAPGHGGIVQHHGRQIGLYRREDGALFAVEPVCPHRKRALVWNDEEKTWDCPCHGSRFDYQGHRLYHPAKAALRTIDGLNAQEI
ncbi:MAG: FAD-dependent oxidoreductase [Oscillospiraceae bacterium]|nr:FAD-dependent oxidoreductase [Oscillospiraceae bacterium]